MNDRSTPPERRLDRRIPLGCAASIHLRGEVVAAECVEISVSGMTLRSSYVPGENEVIEVSILPPGQTLGPRYEYERPPLITRLQVKRCHALGDGRYEIGGAIVRVVG